jgi:hypothetical protein
MTEEITKPRRGGWPKGRPRTTTKPRAKMTAETMKASLAEQQMLFMKSKMKARPNWESDDFGMEAGADVLGISQETVDALARDGVALEWATSSVYGQEMKRELRQTFSNGWTPVHLTDFDGVLDTGKFAPKGADESIQVGACMLVARPMQLHQKAKLQAKRDADEFVEAPTRMLRDGINVKGGNHPSVRNQINVQMDRVDIPD